jgi:hypothetical protein
MRSAPLRPAGNILFFYIKKKAFLLKVTIRCADCKLPLLIEVDTREMLTKSRVGVKQTFCP